MEQSSRAVKVRCRTRATGVPFIANWSGTIKPDQGRQKIIDFSDILPTLCDAAGYDIPANLKIDGRSIYPLLTGSNYEQRDWIYLWYARNGGPKGQEFTRDQNYKLYGDGKFYDLSKDRLEQNPLPKQAHKKKDTISYEKLAKALSRYKGIRTITSTKLPGEAKGKKDKKK